MTKLLALFDPSRLHNAEGATRKLKLTKRAVEASAPGVSDRWLWDAELPGFGLRVKPSGVRTYVVQYRNQSGRTRRLALGQHGVITAEQARQLARQRLGEVAAGSDPSAERQARRKAMTVSQACDRYVEEYAEIHKKKSSVKEDRRLIEKRIRPELGPLPLEGVTRDDVLRLHLALKRTPYEANRAVALLSKLFNLAEGDWGVRPAGSNPCHKLRRYKEEKRTRFLSAGELGRLGETLDKAEADGSESSAVILAIRLLALTGCRLGEIRKLRWEDVRLADGVLSLRDAKRGARDVPLGREAVARLRRTERQGEFVVLSSSGDREMGESTLEAAWRRLRIKAQLDTRLHDFRHTVGTYAGAMPNTSAFLVRDLLGLKTMAMTDRYVERNIDPLHAIADGVGDTIDSAMRKRRPTDVTA